MSIAIWGLAFGVLMLSIAILIQVFSKNLKLKKNDRILIVGNMGSGKTKLWGNLCYEINIDSQTSIEKNELEKVIYVGGRERSISLIDIPGHPKLRMEFSEFTPISKGVIFVIDSSTIESDYQSVSEYLYDVLSDKNIQKQQIPITILCNKQDIESSLKVKEIEAILCREINRLRETRQNSLQKHDIDQNEDNEFNEFLGLDGKIFEFQDLDNSVRFIKNEASKDRLGAKGVDEIKDWIDSLFD